MKLNFTGVRLLAVARRSWGIFAERPTQVRESRAPWRICSKTQIGPATRLQEPTARPTDPRR